jgi:hypothetical protein
MTLDIEQTPMRPCRIRCIPWKNDDVTGTMDDHHALETRRNQSFRPK